MRLLGFIGILNCAGAEQKKNRKVAKKEIVRAAPEKDHLKSLEKDPHKFIVYQTSLDNVEHRLRGVKATIAFGFIL